MVPTIPAAGWGGKFVSFWTRMVAWLEACSRRFHVSSFGRSAARDLDGMWQGGHADKEFFFNQLKELISEEAVGLLPGLLEVAKRQHKLHVHSWQQDKSASYAKWLRKVNTEGHVSLVQKC